MSENLIEHCHTKKFCFKSTNEAGIRRDNLSVNIIEIVHPSYSSQTWASAPVLALYLWKHEELRDKHVLELGAGTALPGLVAAKCGAYVTLSESALLPKSIERLHRSCEENELRRNRVQVIGLTWGLFTKSVLNLQPVDLIIGSDCFFEPKLFENIIATVAFLLEKNPQAKFLSTYQERSANWSIEHLLSKWNLKCNEICIDNLGDDCRIDVTVAEGRTIHWDSDCMQQHTIHLLQISRR